MGVIPCDPLRFGKRAGVICVFVLCICVLVYLCISVFVFVNMYFQEPTKRFGKGGRAICVLLHKAGANGH